MLEEYIIHSYVLLFVGRILDNSTKDLKFAFTNLTPFTVYDAYVAAETSAGIGPKSNISVFTPPEGKSISSSVWMGTLLTQLHIVLETLWLIFI